MSLGLEPIAGGHQPTSELWALLCGVKNRSGPLGGEGKRDVRSCIGGVNAGRRV